MKKRRDTDSSRIKLKSLWQAFDDAAFGSERTLNLRDLLPSAAEARARTEVWLRARQATRPEEVLIITGRGNQSAGGVGVISQEILAMLPSLRRRGIVESWREHTPGSIIVKLAPVSSLLDAGRRRRDPPLSSTAPSVTISGLSREANQRLRELAILNLDMIGVSATEEFIAREMLRAFTVLAESIRDQPEPERAVHEAISNALEEAIRR